MTLFIQQSPLILTDNIYTLYGGLTGSSIAAQRQIAYTLAEEAAQQDIGTFLLPTIVTGTYILDGKMEVELEHSYVRRVLMTWVKSFDGKIQFTISGTSNNYLAIRDGDYGIIDFGFMCYWAGYIYAPYQADVVYEAGLPSGTTYTPNMLLALTTYAQIALNEMIGYGNEAPGDIGVQKYTNQDYSEERIKLMNTSFGSSPKGLFAHKLLRKFQRNRKVGLGRPIR